MRFIDGIIRVRAFLGYEIREGGKDREMFGQVHFFPQVVRQGKFDYHFFLQPAKWSKDEFQKFGTPACSIKKQNMRQPPKND
jgi:hypothetical protein